MVARNLVRRDLTMQVWHLRRGGANGPLKLLHRGNAKQQVIDVKAAELKPIDTAWSHSHNDHARSRLIGAGFKDIQDSVASAPKQGRFKDEQIGAPLRNSLDAFNAAIGQGNFMS
jgi:hypothetical protein